ncbi:hypothetical protein HLV37_03435 [Eggerthellaceae bacterium zg-1084]|uniref:hypothetical protein n=1 Tax=Berryella wangjianweii TaxID=2734634 RepID=UPI001558043F|nr:hypothetical protein [Berryella wangjianweii]NPD30928.1 hypothetical protein [Berryella wangjianweii]NPD31793.1 hypothetical protein [Eggerthellaceae bacterium zg-997]
MPAAYTGSYARFTCPSKKNAAVLIGADCIVGDEVRFELRTEDGETTAWLMNRFDAVIGSLSKEDTHQLRIRQAEGRSIRILLGLIAYSETPEPGQYWGEVLIFSHTPASAEFVDPFIDRVATALRQGVRPAIDLSESDLAALEANPQQWITSGRVPLPQIKAGMAVLKSRQSLTDRLVEQARRGNKGCAVVGWGGLLIGMAGIAALLKFLGVF